MARVANDKKRKLRELKVFKKVENLKKELERCVDIFIPLKFYENIQKLKICIYHAYKKARKWREVKCYVRNVHNKSESQLQRPKWSLISAKYCDIMWALLLLEIKINFIFCNNRNVATAKM